MVSADPIIQGTTRPSLPIQWLRSDNTPLPITGATITGRMRHTVTGETKDLAGSFSITDGPNGRCTYSWVESDTNTPGNWVVRLTATISGQTYKARFLLPIEEDF